MHEAHARTRPCRSLPFGPVTLLAWVQPVTAPQHDSQRSIPAGQPNRSTHHSEPSAGSPAASSCETTPCGEWALSRAGPTERHSMLASLHPVPGRDVIEMGRLRHPVPHCAELAGACSCWFSFRQRTVSRCSLPLAGSSWVHSLDAAHGFSSWLPTERVDQGGALCHVGQLARTPTRCMGSASGGFGLPGAAAPVPCQPLWGQWGPVHSGVCQYRRRATVGSSSAVGWACARSRREQQRLGWRRCGGGAAGGGMGWAPGRPPASAIVFGPSI